MTYPPTDPAFEGLAERLITAVERWMEDHADADHAILIVMAAMELAGNVVAEAPDDIRDAVVQDAIGWFRQVVDVNSEKVH